MRCLDYRAGTMTPGRLTDRHKRSKAASGFACLHWGGNTNIRYKDLGICVMVRGVWTIF